jgi:hypothetical protein
MADLKNQEESDVTGTHHLLICAEDAGSLGKAITAMSKECRSAD